MNPWAALRNPLSELFARLDRLQRAPIEEDLHGIALAVSNSARAAETVALLHLGWSDRPAHTLREVESTIGLTQEGVRQIELRFLRNLASRRVYAPQLLRAVQCAESMAHRCDANLSKMLMLCNLAHHCWAASTLVTAAGVLADELQRLGFAAGNCCGREDTAGSPLDR